MAKPGSSPLRSAQDYRSLTRRIKEWGRELGFQQVGISDTSLDAAEQRLAAWLEKGRHGEMDYMARHGSKRSRPAELVAGTVRVICVRMDYLPEPQTGIQAAIEDPVRAFVSRYALGRDYHKVLRRRLQRLAERIGREVGEFGHRVFVDSAPVLEKPLAEKAGLGWIGKHTNLINARAGSWFFLGELYLDLPLPVDVPAQNHCGTCRACMDICPTGAIVAPYELDARLCISYLTIEHKGAIPERLRPLLGNRIYGCDDCQLVCPWNRFATLSEEVDFLPRARVDRAGVDRTGLDRAGLLELFAWSEAEFLQRTQGSAIRRIGHAPWLRNLAVALGNTPDSAGVLDALHKRMHHPSEMVREHVTWAVERHTRSRCSR